MHSTFPAPAFALELEAVLSVINKVSPSSVRADDIDSVRANFAASSRSIDDLIADRAITHAQYTVASYDGAQITVSVLARTDHTGTGSGIYYIHGGGMISGNRFATNMPDLLNWVDQHDAVVATVEYRLAPEFPDPVPVEDCYAGLVWLFDHASELGIDSSRIIIAGASAGGGLAAGVTLLARDRNGPKLAAQLLMCPMLDDRSQTISSNQFVGIGLWDRISNETGWTALLGDRRGGNDVSIYAAPARAVDLSGLPPAYIDAGSAEVFRDEDVEYASRIWACGGAAELHVWDGGFHGFDLMAPQADVSVEARQTRDVWVRRQLARE